MSYVRSRGKSLGLIELSAIAIGGMVGGGIFSILGISVKMVGMLTPIAIAIGGLVATLAAYSYVKLGVYYKDPGATYAFIKRTFTNSHKMASAIGWITIFGYISTLALYSYTFASYAISGSEWAHNVWVRKAVALGVIMIFALINLWSVKGMGKIEDIMVYTKLIILAVISILLMQHGKMSFSAFLDQMLVDAQHSQLLHILIVSSITFVAYEGFQLVINAVNEMDNPEKLIPRAIYTSIAIVILIYVILSLGALFAIPKEELIKNKEYALAAGASKILGKFGEWLVIFSALLSTSSAISGTIFGSSRQMAAIAEDGYFPSFLAKKKKNIPVNAILTMSFFASFLIIIGGLRLILEFGSITFLLISLLVAYTNFVIRDKTKSSTWLTILSILGLGTGTILILYYEAQTKPQQMVFILFMYILLGTGSYLYGKRRDLLEQKNS
jgi:amino acid transporter